MNTAASLSMHNSHFEWEIAFGDGSTEPYFDASLILLDWKSGVSFSRGSNPPDDDGSVTSVASVPKHSALVNISWTWISY
jgi:hypothetical protein